MSEGELKTGQVKFEFGKLKDYVFLVGIVFAITLPFVQKKLGISDLQSRQTQLVVEIQKLKESNCDTILLMRGSLRLQNEVYNSNELLFSKLKADPIEINNTRSRVSEVRKELLEDIKSVSVKNECVF